MFWNLVSKVSFPNYKNFEILTQHITTLSTDSNVLLSFQTIRVKNNTSEWFDGEITGKIHKRDELYKRFKLTKLTFDEEIYQEARNVVQKFIRKKKNVYFQEKLKENTKNSKKLWKTLKQLALPDKRLPSTNIYIEAKNGLTFNPFTISEKISLALQTISQKRFLRQLKSLVTNLQKIIIVICLI